MKNPLTRLCIISTVFLFILIASGRAQDEHWYRYSTPHFSLLARSRDPRFPSVLDVLEAYRTILNQTGWENEIPKVRVDILVLDGEKDFEQYRQVDWSLAFHVRRVGHDFIVIRDSDPALPTTALHEYTHALLSSKHLALPLWLEEGLCQFNSARRSPWEDSGTADQGTPIASPTPFFADLLDRNSVVYPEANLVPQFYASSLRLVKTLQLDPHFSPRFLTLVKSLNSEEPFCKSFYSTYGTTCDSLVDYVGRTPSLHPERYDNQPPVSPAPSVIVTEDEPSVAWTQAIIACIRFTQITSRADFQTVNSDLSKLDDRSGQLMELLGIAALAANRRTEALGYLRKSIFGGSENVDALIVYARLAASLNLPARDSLPVLKKARNLDPEDQEALLLEGEIAARAGDYRLAEQDMNAYHSADRRGMFIRFYTLAYCAEKTNNRESLIKCCDKAEQLAQSAEERAIVDKLKATLGQKSPSA